MAEARMFVIGVGILLPYVARLPGTYLHGSRWFAEFLGSGPEAVVFVSLLNAICWGAVAGSTFAYRHPKSALFPAVVGFAFPAVAYGALDLRSSSTAAMALVVIPLWSLPLVLIGWIAGFAYDRRLTRIEARSTASGEHRDSEDSHSEFTRRQSGNEA